MLHAPANGFLQRNLGAEGGTESLVYVVPLIAWPWDRGFGDNIGAAFSGIQGVRRANVGRFRWSACGIRFDSGAVVTVGKSENGNECTK
jgi:hypothetical protein